MDIIGEQIYDELNHFIDARRGGEIDRFPWNDKLRSREFPCALQGALSGEETNDRYKVVAPR